MAQARLDAALDGQDDLAFLDAIGRLGDARKDLPAVREAVPHGEAAVRTELDRFALQGDAGSGHRATEDDHLGVDLSATKTQGLGTDLMKLTVAAFLRALMAKHGPHVVHALTAVVEQIVLDRGAYHAGRGFRPQSERVTVQAIFEGVHLFGDDVRGLTHTAFEQRGVLEHRRLHVAVARSGQA